MQEIFWGLTLIDLAVIAGVALVAPVLREVRAWQWWAIAVTVVAACRADRGSAVAVALAAPWVVVSIWLVGRRVRDVGPLYFWGREDAVAIVARLSCLVAAGGFAFSSAGLTPFGVGEPIVELTAVHFLYAGIGALELARCASRARPGRPAQLALFGTASAPPLVATGFVTGWALPQVGGAIVLTLGVWATAALELNEAVRDDVPPLARPLLAISGLAVWAPMVLAVAWAAGQHWDVPALSIPDMVRTHGAVNAVGFIGAGLAARALEARRRLKPVDEPEVVTV